MATEDLTFVDALVQLSFLIQTVLGGVAATHDLSIIQARLLGVLRDRELSMAQLAEHLHLDKSSITGLVQRAEQRGLVQRRPTTEDRRVVKVSCTDAGRQFVEDAADEVGREIRRLAACLSESDQLRLTQYASRIVGSSSSVPAADPRID